MRVLILGSVVNQYSSGGVGVFDEGLYNGFKQLNDDVQILSFDKSSLIDNIQVGKQRASKSQIIFKKRLIAKEIKKYHPDLVISSVQYSIPIKTYKKYWDKAKYVQVLHGVAWPINGKLKAAIVNKVAKRSRKYFDYVVTVSYLSFALNLQYNGFKCDKVIHNGCNMAPYYGNNREYDFIYIGRLFPDKQIELLADACLELCKLNPNIRVAFAGFGELEHLFTEGKYSNSKIEYLGRLTQSEAADLYKKAKIFVSLHPTETFGTVFNEAILNGCNIATQSTTGVAALYAKTEYFHQLDCINPKELAHEMNEALKKYKPVSKEFINYMSAYLSYKNVGAKYKELVSE